MNLSPTQYDTLVKRASPKSKSKKTIIRSFLIGGAICTVGQLLRSLFLSLDISQTHTATLVAASLVALSALLTGLGIYDNIAKHAGAGTLVPITGFANAVVSPALEFKSEGFILGVGAKIFIIAGPVIAYGTIASVIYGVIYWLFTAAF